MYLNLNTCVGNGPFPAANWYFFVGNGLCPSATTKKAIADEGLLVFRQKAVISSSAMAFFRRQRQKRPLPTKDYWLSGRKPVLLRRKRSLSVGNDEKAIVDEGLLGFPAESRYIFVGSGLFPSATTKKAKGLVLGL